MQAKQHESKGHYQKKNQKQASTRESVIDLAPYVDKKVRVKFVGGREVVGVLKGADPVCNMVLDDAVEYLRDGNDTYNITEETRELGILIARGPTVLSICKDDGFSFAVENPYAEAEQE